MSSSKRVSFGENGSMVETLIIDNSNMPAEEKHFYQENILRGNVTADLNKGRLKDDMESHENPFMAGGELDSKADYIIRHSKISRTEIRIADPDSPQPQEEIQMETIEKVEAAPVSGAAPGGNPKENGKVEDPLKPQNVEVEVDKANASQPETQEPEQVKSKDKKPKCKCCVIQ